MVENYSPGSDPEHYITLEVMEGKKPLNSSGQMDPRLFSGTNRIIVECDDTSLWSLRYEFGVTPSTLQGKFTSAAKLMNFVEDYYKKRNIIAKEVRVA